MTLRLSQLQEPLWPGPVRIFRDWEHACRHVCDHLLSNPESAGWALLLPAVHDLLLSDEPTRRDLAASAWAAGDQGDSLQGLYDGYADEIKRAAADGRRLRWHWREGGSGIGTTKLLGTSGALVVVSGEGTCVRTAYLPGLGVAERVRMHPQTADTAVARRTDPLSRDHPRALPGIGPGPGAQYRLFVRCARYVRAEALVELRRRGRDRSAQALEVAILDLEAWRACVEVETA